MAKQFTKKKKPVAATTPEDKLLERLRRNQARTLRKRRQRKSHQ